jgi:hypothetical protein
MNNELTKLMNYEQVKLCANIVLDKNVPYLADWEIGVTTILDSIGMFLQIKEAIERQNPGKVFAGPNMTRSHAIELKNRMSEANIMCAYVELVFINIVSKETSFIWGINAFPILDNGTVYYNPAIRCFISDSIEEGLDFGETKLKTCALIW